MSVLVTKARLLRVSQSADCFSWWCAKKCPFAAIILVVAVHLFAAVWWKVICNSLIAVAVMVMFCAFGFSGIMNSLTVRRADRWYERLGTALGIGVGVLLILVGFLGGWAFFQSAVLGLQPNK